MFPSSSPRAAIEPLEARIAPALAVLNPLADLVIGPAKTGVDIDLARIFDPIITDNGHTIVTLQTNFDSDPNVAGVQPSLPIVIELFDDVAPLSVQNFLGYLESTDFRANYLGTIFHRSFDFGSSSEAGKDIVQGGGFKAATPTTHISVKFDVHNEYSEAYPNVRGTLAVAKTGLGPNTGTSEWFINTTNNSSILGGDNNGGFAVFGRVVQGMEVVDGIAKLQTYNLGALNGAFSDLPLQNYQPNPDNNPNTAAPFPSSANFVTLTNVTKSKLPAGTLTGVTYSVAPSVDIVDATTGLASDLVTPTIIGANLHLNFKAHAAGVVRVTVHGSDANSTAMDTFVVNLQPNLLADFDQDPFDGIIVGGDTKTANIVVGNSGGGWAVGKVDVKVYLSKVRADVDPTGYLLQPADDLLFAEFTNQSIDIAGGGIATLTKNLQIPKQLVTTSGEGYRILVNVTPSDTVIQERFTDDNVSLDSSAHQWENRFGTFTVNGVTRTHARLEYVEPDGDAVQFSITKDGNGLVSFDGSKVDLAVVSPRPASVLAATVVSSATVGEHDIDLRNVELLQYIGTVQMPQANLSGVLSAVEGFGTLTAGDLTGPGVITIGKLRSGITVNPMMTFRNVSDVSIDSQSTIRLLRAASWLETDGTPNHIDAPAIVNLAIRGNLEANLGLTSAKSLSLFYLGGFFKDATFLAKGDVGTVDVGGLDHANIFVGTTARPGNLGDFDQLRSIASLTVHGVTGAPRSFIASNVAAAYLGPTFVTRIDSINSSARFGIVADAVRSYNHMGGLSAGLLTGPERFDVQGRYSLTVL